MGNCVCYCLLDSPGLCLAWKIFILMAGSHVRSYINGINASQIMKNYLVLYNQEMIVNKTFIMIISEILAITRLFMYSIAF